MQIRMVNTPSFMEVFSKTRGPQLFENGYKDMTKEGGFIIGLGILAMLGGFFAGGIAAVPAGLLVMGLVYTVMKVQRARQKWAQLQEHLKVLSGGATLQPEAKSLASRFDKIRGIEDEAERLAAYEALDKEVEATAKARYEDNLQSAATRINWLWPGAKFEVRSSEAAAWEEYALKAYMI